jgi:hypothetical protein
MYISSELVPYSSVYCTVLCILLINMLISVNPLRIRAEAMYVACSYYEPFFSSFGGYTVRKELTSSRPKAFSLFDTDTFC